MKTQTKQTANILIAIGRHSKNGGRPVKITGVCFNEDGSKYVKLEDTANTSAWAGEEETALRMLANLADSYLDAAKAPEQACVVVSENNNGNPKFFKVAL